MSILGQIGKNNNFIVTAIAWTIPAVILGYLMFTLKLPLFVQFIGFNVCALGAIFTSGLIRRLKGNRSLKRIFLIASAIFLIALIITPPPAQAAQIKEFTIPAGGSQPYDIVADTQSPYRVWWTEYGSDRIGNIKSDTGEITEYNLGTAARPWGITINYAEDPDRLYWTENSANMIGRMDVDGGGAKKRYPLGTTYGSGPRGISAENRTDKELVWFTLYDGNRICRMNLTSPNHDHPVIDQWYVPGIGSNPQRLIYSELWGGVWFTEYSSDQIGFLNPSVNLFKEWTLPTSNSFPFDIDIDSYGYVWFSMSGTNKIGKLNPYTNVITEYVMPDSNSRPFGIVVDSADAIWIADNGANKIVRFTADLVFTEFAKPGGGSPWGITAKSSSPDMIWATDGTTKILRLDPSIAVTTTTVPTTSQVTTTITTTTGSTTTLSSTMTGRYYFSTTNVATGTAAVTTTTAASSTEYTVSETVRHVYTTTVATSTSYVSTTTDTLTTNTTLSETSTSYIGTTSATKTLTSTVNGTYTEYIATVTTTAPAPTNACIIATAAYGSELSPEVSFLRAFRDQTVMSTFAGKQFMSVFNAWYYSFSPHVAEVIAGNAFAKSIMKAALYPLIGALAIAQYTSSSLFNLNPELAMVTGGIVASSIIGIVYFAPVAILFLLRIRRYYRMKNNSHTLIALASLWLASALGLTIGEFLLSPVLVMFSTAMLVLATLTFSGVAIASLILQRSAKF